MLMNEKMNKKPVIIENGEIKKLNKILLNSNTFKAEYCNQVKWKINCVRFLYLSCIMMEFVMRSKRKVMAI